MRLCVVGVILLFGLSLAWAEIKSPKVHVYTERPYTPGDKNVLICYVSDFHPPLIEVKLLKNGVEIPNCKRNDPSFQRDWSYQMLVSVETAMQDSDSLQCEVSHNGVTKTYELIL